MLLWIILPVLFIKLNTFLNLPIFLIPFGKLLGIILMTASIFLVIWCSLKHYKTGRTTVVPIQNAISLIDKDIYQYTRNPIYLGAIMFFLGLFFYTGYPTIFIYFLTSIPILHFYVVYIEEPECRKSLGKSYVEYCKNVPRWMPRLLKI